MPPPAAAAMATLAAAAANAAATALPLPSPTPQCCHCHRCCAETQLCCRCHCHCCCAATAALPQPPMLRCRSHHCATKAMAVLPLRYQWNVQGQRHGLDQKKTVPPDGHDGWILGPRRRDLPGVQGEHLARGPNPRVVLVHRPLRRSVVPAEPFHQHPEPPPRNRNHPHRGRPGPTAARPSRTPSWRTGTLSGRGGTPPCASARSAIFSLAPHPQNRHVAVRPQSRILPRRRSSADTDRAAKKERQLGHLAKADGSSGLSDPPS